MDEKYKSKKMCNAGKSILNICANGDVTPCPHIRHSVIGNILKDSFDKLWHHPELDQDYVCTECLKCTHFSSCGGGCKGISVDKKDPLCWAKSQ